MTKLTPAQTRIVEALKAGSTIEFEGWPSYLYKLYPPRDAEGRVDWGKVTTIPQPTMTKLEKAGVLRFVPRVLDAKGFIVRERHWVAA